MKQENAILIGAGVVIAGFFGYRYFKKKQDEKKVLAEKTEENNINNPNITTGYPGQYTGPSNYKKLVMDIQSILGVAIDGDPGQQTNGALQKKAPLTFAKIGPVSPANAQFYVTLLTGPSFLIL
jgi:hypothetical protein